MSGAAPRAQRSNFQRGYHRWRPDSDAPRRQADKRNTSCSFHHSCMAPKKTPTNFDVDGVVCTVNNGLVNAGLNSGWPRELRFPVKVKPDTPLDDVKSKVREHPKFAAIATYRGASPHSNSPSHTRLRKSAHAFLDGLVQRQSARAQARLHPWTTCRQLQARAARAARSARTRATCCDSRGAELALSGCDTTRRSARMGRFAPKGNGRRLCGRQG